MLTLSIHTEKQCNSCKKMKSLDKYSGKSSNDLNLNATCDECCISTWRYKNTFDGFIGKILSAARSDAKKRLSKGRTEAGVCNIIREDLINIWNRQNGKCYYSNIPMNLKQCSDWMCSLERLDNDKGYTIDNIALVCHEFNNENKWTLEKIARMIFSVYEYHDDVLLLKEINNSLNGKNSNINSGKKYKEIVKNELNQYKCKKCDIFKDESEFTKVTHEGCKECRKKYREKRRSTIKVHLYTLFNDAKNSTKKRNENINRSGDNSFDITYEYLKILLQNQRGRCAYSGIKLWT